MLLQVIFAGPGRTIDALQHFVAVVSPPVSTGELHQLEVLQLARAGHMRATAQILENTFTIQGYIFVGRDAGDDLCFVMLAHTFEISHGLIAGQNASRDGLVFRNQSEHLFFNSGQIFRREGTFV